MGPGIRIGDEGNVLISRVSRNIERVRKHVKVDFSERGVPLSRQSDTDFVLRWVGSIVAKSRVQEFGQLNFHSCAHASEQSYETRV